METRASYVFVGIFVLGLIAAGIVFVMWLAGQGGAPDSITLRVHFTRDVTGLGKDSTVRYRGIPVGKVVKIGVWEKNPDIIEVLIRVEPDTPIWTDTFASLESQGLTGAPFVQLKRPREPAKEPGQPPPRQLSADELRKLPEPYLIHGEPTGLQQLFEEFPRAVAAITRFADSATKLANTAAAFLSAANAKRFEAIIQNVEVASANIRNATERIRGAVGPDVGKRVDGILTSLEQASRNASDILSEQNRKRIDQIIKDAEATTGNVSEITRRANLLLDEENRKRLASILKNVDVAARDARGFLTEAEKLTKSLGPGAKELGPALKNFAATVKDIQASAKAFGQMSNEVAQLVRENRRPIRTFTSNGLYGFAQLVTDVRSFARAAERVFRRMENDPSAFFFGRRRGYSPGRR